MKSTATPSKARPGGFRWQTASLATLVFCWPVSGSEAAQGEIQDCALPISPPPSQARVVFLLDTSGSMEGRGNSVANIFPRIKGAMLRGMRANTAPGSVELLTFDQGPRRRLSFAWPTERGSFERTVNTLTAPGANTWLYSSMQALFSSLGSQPQAATTVYVITDGLDNNPSRAATLDTALAAFNTVRGPLDKLYYVGLGQKIPAEIQNRFAQTTFARTISLPAGKAPDLTSVALSPGVVTVGTDGSFPFQHPGEAALTLESGSIGGAAVEIRNPSAPGQRVSLGIKGTVPAGSVGYMCARIGGVRQNVLLRFVADTPPLNAAPAPVDVLGTLLLLNPQAERTLKRGQSTVLEYQAVRGPVTVEVAEVPPELAATLPDQIVSLLEGEKVTLRVTDKGLSEGQQAAPTLRLNDAQVYPVPRVTGRVVRPFPWWWLLLGLLLLALAALLISRARRVFRPYALSVDRRRRVFLHDRGGQRRSRLLKQDQTDVGAVFREPQLRGLSLELYRPEIVPADEVLLDNSSVASIRDYSDQRTARAVRLQAQPDTLRLNPGDAAAGTPTATVSLPATPPLSSPPLLVPPVPEPTAPPVLALQETLVPGQLYLFTDYTAPPVRVRPPLPPPEPPIEVIVTLLSSAQPAAAQPVSGQPAAAQASSAPAHQMQELELPLEDADLADVFGDERLRGLVVCREPGLLRLRALATDMRLRHISREFRAGEALPLSVMLGLQTAAASMQLRVRDKSSMERYRR
jgi:von Willebrand factor type A domain